jgi:hypothetical protein
MFRFVPKQISRSIKSYILYFYKLHMHGHTLNHLVLYLKLKKYSTTWCHRRYGCTIAHPIHILRATAKEASGGCRSDYQPTNSCNIVGVVMGG